MTWQWTLYAWACMLVFAGTFSVLPTQLVFATNAATLEPDCPRIVLDTTATSGLLAENTIAGQNQVPMFQALSQLWLGRNERAANVTLIQVSKSLRGSAQTLTPDIADKNFKWQMRLWLRAYGLFNRRNGYFTGRLEAATEDFFHELFWNYAFAKSTVDRANHRFDWFIQGSENHDLMDLSNAFLALEALQHVPLYANRPLRDGRSIAEHIDAWTAYFCRYADQRVARGLLIECGSSIYGKYAIPEIVNMADFAGDPVLRRKMTMLLDVLWADWAVEQIDGIRGGGKSRVYQGKYSRFGNRDSYRNMADVLLGRGAWTDGKHGHTNSGYVYCLAMSRYRLPIVVAKLASNRPTRPYVSISRRLAKMTSIEKLPDYQPHPNWYVLDPEDTRAVRYTYCTSDYIMGTWWVDPTLGVASVANARDRHLGKANYAAIHAQNRWQGVLFRGDPNLRVYPQCFTTRADKNDSSVSVSYHQQIAVQHKNVMMVQANRKREDIQSMRVYFAPSIRSDLVEHDDWLIAPAGNAYVASTAIDLKANSLGGHWQHENYFTFDDLNVPILVVAGSRERFDSVDQFIVYLESIHCTSEEGMLSVRFRDADNQLAKLEFDPRQKVLPRVNGTTVNLNPKMVYDCPTMRSDFGSGIVTMGQGEDVYVWNMHNNSIRKQTLESR